MLKINQQNTGGMTALHYASANGHTEIVKSLLNHKDIDVNIKNMLKKASDMPRRFQISTEIMKLLEEKEKEEEKKRTEEA